MIASLVIGGVLLAGMIVATGYAAVRLPGTARVPLHAGVFEYRIWLSKRAGLSAWLAAGAAVFALLAWLSLSRMAANWASSMRMTLLPAVMCVALAAEVAAIIMARQAAAELLITARCRVTADNSNRRRSEGDNSGQAGATNAEDRIAGGCGTS